MKKISKEVARKISGGGAHYHWSCSPHGYISVARDYSSCMVYKNLHNTKYHDGNAIAGYYPCSLTSGNCSKIYTN